MKKIISLSIFFILIFSISAIARDAEQFKAKSLHFQMKMESIVPNRIIDENNVFEETKKIVSHFKKTNLFPNVKMPSSVEFSDDLKYAASWSPGTDEIKIARSLLTEDNFLIALHLTHELIHCQGSADETITDIISLIVISQLAKTDDIYKKALYWRLADQIYFAPLFFILYDEDLPKNHMDIFLSSVKGTCHMHEDDCVETKLIFPEHDEINDFIDYAVKMNVITNDDRKEYYDHLKNKLFSNSHHRTTKVNIMQYGLLPYSIIENAINDNNTIVAAAFDSYPKYFEGLKIDDLASFINL